VVEESEDEEAAQELVEDGESDENRLHASELFFKQIESNKVILKTAIYIIQCEQV
jgi:hypothetical protein